MKNKSIKLFFTLIVLVMGVFVVGCTQTNSREKIAATGSVVELSVSDLSVGNYVLVSDKSLIKWSASKIVGSGHTGNVNLESGKFMFDENGEVSGEFKINMNSISSDENINSLVNHLKSKDFFNIESYPYSTVNLKSMKKLEGNTYEVTVDLTMLDKTEEIVFPATFTAESGMLIVDAKMGVDRTKWGINYNSGSVFKDLGDKAINDEVKLELSLEFKRIE